MVDKRSSKVCSTNKIDKNVSKKKSRQKIGLKYLAIELLRPLASLDEFF